jgi:hypothetical protein
MRKMDVPEFARVSAATLRKLVGVAQKDAESTIQKKSSSNKGGK